jgi:endonuclease III
MEIEERAELVYKRLLDFYGKAEWRHPLPPVDELISTVLSQNTNDVNRDRAYQALRDRFPTWEAVRDAPEEDVIAVIRPAGLANQKGPRIQAILREITNQRGQLELDFLRDLPVNEASEWLLKFNGVGPKTAAIVLLFSMGKPAFPVDTHIYRVSGRLGIRPLKMSPDQAHDHLAKLFQADDYQVAHLNLIRLGREICQARKPMCPICPLKEICQFAQETRQ